GAIQRDVRDHLPAGHGIAIADQYLNDRAAGWGGELDVDLVGRDLDNRVGSLDEVADLGMPFEDRSLAHGLPSSRRHNLDYLIGGGACGHLSATLARRSPALRAHELEAPEEGPDPSKDGHGDGHAHADHAPARSQRAGDRHGDPEQPVREAENER